MSTRIVVLAGDGVGPEVTAAAVRVLERVSNDRVAVLAPSVEGRPLEEKLAVLKGW